MNEFLDILWLKIVVVLQGIGHGMDILVSPLNALGPGVAIFVLVVIMVAATKFFKKHYKTKRYVALKAEFDHWAAVRQEAMDLEDREKGKALAKNIDQAKLNKVYYDYFFEGLLNNILTSILPMLIMAAYVNDAYRTEKLVENFGRSQVFNLYGFGGDPIPVGALAWFVLSFVLVHVIWAVAGWQYKKRTDAHSDGHQNKET